MYLKPMHLPKASILVLEKDPFLRAGLCSTLTAAGYVLAEGTGGANPAGRVDLVLAAMGPDQKPEAALELLDRAMPVVLMVDGTAWSGLDFFDAANALGAAAVLMRPFSRSALLCLVAKVLSQPMRDPGEAEPAELPILAELLIHLDNPNFV
jgi:AmiR/NasT family two-component response regulator